MYKRLSFIEREEISRQLAYGNNIRAIAIILNKSPSTISREITLNVVHTKYYRALFGQQRAKEEILDVVRIPLNNNMLEKNYSFLPIPIFFLQNY